MIISAGKYKGTRLLYPKNRSFRPTKQIVREALFDILQSRINRSGQFLDLFAGSGAVGLEAVSRGFQSVTLIDSDISYLKKNIVRFDNAEPVKYYKQDALKAIEILKKKGHNFSVIFLDPPYESNLVPDSLNKLYHFDILESGALIVVEHETSKVITDEHFILEKEYKYGLTTLSLLKKGTR